MKLRTNLIRPVTVWARLTAIGLYALAAVFAASAVWMFAGYGRDAARLPGLEDRLARLSREETQALAARSQQPLVDLLDVRKRITRLNRILDSAGEAPVGLLDRLEGLLPANCYLVALSYKRASGDTVITAESIDGDALNRLLARAEGDSNLREVSLLKQERYEAGGKTIVRYELGFKDRL